MMRFTVIGRALLSPWRFRGAALTLPVSRGELVTLNTLPQIDRPRMLYKYCPPERIDILDGLRVRFSPPSDFNDTFDSYDPVSPGARFRTMVRRHRYRDALGILCLTTKADSHLMWVHYARNHTGFVIGFNSSASFFKEGDLRFVEYKPKPKRASHKRACLYKSPEWAYEEEWRCVRRFKESQSRLVAIETDLISEIILGWKMEGLHVAKISQSLTARVSKPAFFQSNPEIQEQKFANRPIELIRCQGCGGRGFNMKSQQ